MHQNSDETRALREKIFEYVRTRMDYDPIPLDYPKSEQDLFAEAGLTLTENGLGGDRALQLFEEVLAPATISTDHPGFVSFIPNAPTEAASLFDLVVSASSIYGGSWMEGAGAVFAENQVLSWFASEVGLPAGSGGAFVQGGTIGNLSALVTARQFHRQRLEDLGINYSGRLSFVASKEAHSSLKAAAKVMDVEIVLAEPGSDGRLTAAAVSKVLSEQPEHSVFAIVATGGTTNFGIVDDLRGIGEIAKAHGLWFHIDGAYGLAGVLSPKYKHLFDGSELADSFIVDPHKWLFAPYDACALVYRDPDIARATHTQHASYLDALHDGTWNPSDYAIQLTRRTRGLPFWFSLAAAGTDAYRDAMEETLQVARDAAVIIKDHPNLELLREPDLSIVAFTRKGWSKDQYQQWSNQLLEDQIGFVTPSSHDGEPLLRFAIVNPWTTIADIKAILATL